MRLTVPAALLWLAAPVAIAQSVTVTVNGNQGPWQQNLNPNFSFGSDDNAAPTAVSVTNGITFTAGSTLTVTYVSGTVDVQPNAYAPTDANGVSTYPTNNMVVPTYGDYPSYFMNPSSYPVYAGELVGVFATNGVILGTPFPIGDGPAILTIPANANQLLLGVDDNYYADNTGSWQIKVSSAPTSGQSTTLTVVGDQGPWLQSLNPTLKYGYGDNQAPAVVSASSGIPFAPGQSLTVSYVSGQVDVQPNAYPATDANGVLTDPTNATIIPTYGDYPSFFMNPRVYPVYAGELVGAFGNNGTVVGVPFPIGDGPANFVIPPGATQLLLGVDDDYYSDNTGSWQIKVAYSPLSVSNIVGGASFLPGLVPGAWGTVQGVNLAQTTDTWNNFIVNGQLPTLLDGITVTVAGKPAYIEYINPSQINFIAPNVGPGPQQVVVQNSYGSNTAFTVTAATYGPSFFGWPNGQIVATRQDFSYAVQNGTFPGTVTTPAKPGDTIILWGTGFGPTTPAAPEGQATPSGQTYSTTTLPLVNVGNVTTTVYGCALAPGFAGLYQLAILIPISLSSGSYPVTAVIGGAQTPTGQVLVVQP
jgi:uncharacterized protein (TIGR03437 family)